MFEKGVSAGNIKAIKICRRPDNYRGFKRFIGSTIKYGIKIKVPTDKEVKEKLDKVLKNAL
jgi:hypothetical protein